MKFTLLLILFTFCFITKGQVMWQLKKDTVQKWYYQFGDEFNTQNLNTESWNYNTSLDKVKLKDGIVFFDDSKKLNLLSSNQAFKYGFFEVRFKNSLNKNERQSFYLYDEKSNEEITLLNLSGNSKTKLTVSVFGINCCTNYKRKNGKINYLWKTILKTKSQIKNDWNVVSIEWQANTIKWFFNGKPIANFNGTLGEAKKILLSNDILKDSVTVHSIYIDYIRVWSTEDTIADYQNNYKHFENSSNTIDQNKIGYAEIKNKKNCCKAKILDNELANVTLLPIFYNKYSLTCLGKNLGEVKVSVFDNETKKVAGYILNNTEYYVLDLSYLPTGPYTVEISILNKTLLQNIPVINPNKIGEQ